MTQRTARSVSSRQNRPLPGRLPLGGVALALLALVVGTNPAAAAQIAPNGEPVISVTGTGEAIAAAETARYQFSIGPSDPFASFGGPPPAAIEVDEAGIPVNATPEAADGDVDLDPTSDETTGFEVEAPTAPQPLTEEDLEPILEAMADAGVDRAAILVNVSPGATGSGQFGPGGGLIEATVDDPDAAAVADVVAAVTEAADDAGLFVQHAGVEYDLADCSALVREARHSAIDDARAQAEELAELLDVTLGDPVLVADYGSFGREQSADEGCPPTPATSSTVRSNGSTPPLSTRTARPRPPPTPRSTWGSPSSRPPRSRSSRAGGGGPTTGRPPPRTPERITRTIDTQAPRAAGYRAVVAGGDGR